MGCGPGADAVAVAPITKPDLKSWDFFWKLDEGTGTTANSTGTASNPALTLAIAKAASSIPTWGTDAAMGGTIITFGGETTPNRVYRSDDFNLGSVVSLTLATVCKYASLGGAAKYPVIWGHDDYVSTSDRNGYTLYADANAAGLTFYVANGATLQKTVSVSHATCGITVGSIHCIMVVFDGSNQDFFVYVDGVQVISETAVGFGTIGGTGVGSTIDPSIGFQGDPGSYGDQTRCFDGSIAWLAIDNVLYNSSQAATFYAGLGL